MKCGAAWSSLVIRTIGRRAAFAAIDLPIVTLPDAERPEPSCEQETGLGLMRLMHLMQVYRKPPASRPEKGYRWTFLLMGLRAGRLIKVLLRISVIDRCTAGSSTHSSSSGWSLCSNASASSCTHGKAVLVPGPVSEMGWIFVVGSARALPLAADHLSWPVGSVPSKPTRSAGAQIAQLTSTPVQRTGTRVRIHK